MSGDPADTGPGGEEPGRKAKRSHRPKAPEPLPRPLARAMRRCGIRATAELDAEIARLQAVRTAIDVALPALRKVCTEVFYFTHVGRLSPEALERAFAALGVARQAMTGAALGSGGEQSPPATPPGPPREAG